MASLLARLFGRRLDRSAMQPLWTVVVQQARAPHWYSTCGLADTREGRLEAVTMVLALVLLRMERTPDLVEPASLLTEVFIDDMDGQLRNGGVGDLSVGKNMGKLMGMLGGRLGALRSALTQDEAAIAAFAAKNLTFSDDTTPAAMVGEIQNLVQRLKQCSDKDLLAGHISS